MHSEGKYTKASKEYPSADWLHYNLGINDFDALAWALGVKNTM